MNFYDQSLLDRIERQNFAFIICKIEDHVLTITLDREEKRNALHPHMVNEIAFVLNYAHIQKDIWAIVIQAKGNIFCAGADLKAFSGDVGKFNSSIPEPYNKILLGELFHSVHKPIISKIGGDVYAGGLFFVAGSNFVVAGSQVKFGLPEVKRGIFPFQVMNELFKVMPSRNVINWCITGDTLTAQEAFDKGLLTHITDQTNIDLEVDRILNKLRENSPSAIRLGLQAFEKITKEEGKHQYLMQMLRQTIRSKDGLEGIKAFKEKRKPNWTGE